MISRVYMVEATVDERGTPGELIGFFRSSVAADAAATGRGWFNGPGQVTARHIITHNGAFYLLDKDHSTAMSVDMLEKDLPREILRQKEMAWAKLVDVLSSDEISLLGIKEPK